MALNLSAGFAHRQRCRRDRGLRRAGQLEHDPEKWEPAFRKDHAQTKILIRFNLIGSGSSVPPGARRRSLFADRGPVTLS
jgi:hypothetical protein